MEKLSDIYTIINKLGSGSFGDVYLLQDHKNKLYAGKIEDKNKENVRLREEQYIYDILHKKGVYNGIPKIYKFLQTTESNILVMELLGSSLEELFIKHNKLFDFQTTIKLGLKIIEIMENIHNAGIIHRDIKPSNFMVGLNECSNMIYIMDFGLSKQYINKNRHIKLKSERSLVGTARYASINVHMGIEPSRRDDLESIGYMLVYFLKGSLPWQGLKKHKNSDSIQLIGDKKMCTSVDKLCSDIPNNSCLIAYINYCKNLKYDETPDYSYIKSLFSSAISHAPETKFLWE